MVFSRNEFAVFPDPGIEFFLSRFREITMEI